TIDAPQHLITIFLDTEHRLRDHVPRNGRDARTIVAIKLEPIIHTAGTAVLHQRRTRGKTGEQRQYQADGRMQAAELLIIRERQVDVHALEVAPSMAPAVEYAIESPVDFVKVVRPKANFAQGAHP